VIVFVFIYVYMYIYTYSYVYMYISGVGSGVVIVVGSIKHFIYSRTRMLARLHTFTHMHTQAHAYICTNTFIRIHVHTQIIYVQVVNWKFTPEKKYIFISSYIYQWCMKWKFIS